MSLFLLPFGHPLLMPLVGMPSHLLWWLHVLPVAILTWRHGRRAALLAVLAGGALVIAGERTVGAGFGVPADWPTTLTLAGGTLLTHVLVAGFALHARSVAGRYRALFRAARAGILHLNSAGRVVEANPAALKLLGLSADALRGLTPAEVPGLHGCPGPEVLRETPWPAVLCVGAGEFCREVHLSVTAFPAGDGGHQVFLVDRTTEVAQQREIARQGHLSSLGEGLAGVAHELKNPLTVIHTLAEIGAADGALPGETRDDLAEIQRQARNMSEMVKELLGFSRTRRETAAFRLDALVRRTLVMQRMTHGAAVEIAEVLEWTGEVPGSAARVEQILTNLVANAVDAVEPGRGRIEVRVTRVGDGPVRVTVRDNGPGVPRELAEQIFAPFVTTKGEGAGTGLGLAISRKLAETLGGALELDAVGGPGASFTLTLPAVQTAAPPDSVPPGADRARTEPAPVVLAAGPGQLDRGARGA
ncbi:MAG: ATP-binding protein [Longimicrobiales bacterium]|nr:ATP-binding protein [Longimicrobiales bacterium]